MSAPFFSQSWYRVARLKPALRDHVEIKRHRYRGESWYVLEDRLTGRAHRLSPSAYAVAGRLDGGRTVDEIWHAVAERSGEHAPTQDDVLHLLASLHAADLIRTELPPDVGELLHRRRRHVRQMWKQNVTNPLSFRLPLLDPTAFLDRTLPLVRPLFGVAGFLLWLAVVGSGCLLAVTHWDALSENISDRALAADNLVLLALLFPLLKLLHELGHAYAVRVFGGAVNEVGVMLLVFYPMPYVDASAAAAFPEKWRRIVVGAAGMMVELVIAALAMQAWARLEPGLERAVALNVMLIAGVSTLVVNGNPLLRFDGYYILCDFLEIPNLASRANRWIADLVKRFAFGIDGLRPFVATPGEKLAFLLYAPLAYAYRVAIGIGIAVFVASQYFFVGVAIALWSLAATVLLPIGKALWYVATAQEARRQRRRAVLVTGATVAAGLALLFAVPVPSHSLAEGVVWLPDSAEVRAGTNGFAEALAAAPGSRVAAGDTLLILTEPAHEARLRALDWRVRELDQKLLAHRVTDLALAKITEIELERARAERDREVERAAKMAVRAAMSGTFVPVLPGDDLPGRFVREGDLVGHVLPEGASTVRVAVTQSAVDLVRERLRSVELKRSDSLSETIAAQLVRQVPGGRFELPSAALGTAGGGSIAVDPRDRDARTALARVFQFDLALPAEAAGAAVFGGRTYVKFTHQPEPAGLQLWRWARQLFLAEFDV